MVITSATSSSIFQPGFFAIAGVQPVDLLINTSATTSVNNVDIVDISALGQLLSAASIFESGILQSTATSPSGFTTLATATQLFVDAFNNFLQSGSGNLQNPPGLSLGNLFAQALLSQSSGNGTSIIASLSSVGINFVPPLTPNNAGQLTIDFQSLQSAFNANPSGTTSLLAQAIQSIGQEAVAFSSTAVQLENLTQIDTSLNSVITAATSGELATATAGTIAPLVTTSTEQQTTTGLPSVTGTTVTVAQTAIEALTATAPSIAATPLTATTAPATTAQPTTATLGTTELPTTTVSTAIQVETELTTTTTIATTPLAAITTPTTTTLPTVTEALPATEQTTAAAPVATQPATELPTTATPQIATPLAATTQLPAVGLPATAIAAPAATEVPITATPATTPTVSALPTTPLTTPPTTPNVTPTTLINRVVDASDPTIAAAIMAYHLVDGIIDTGARHYTRPPAAFTGRDEVRRVESTHPAKLDLYA